MLSPYFSFPETQYFRSHSVGSQQIDSIPENNEKNLKSQDVRESPSGESLSDTMDQQRPKPYLQELKPRSKVNRNVRYLKLLLRPWPLALYHLVIYVFLLYSAIVGWPLVVINTNATIFQNKPYNMTPGINSLIKIPQFIGCLLGAYCAGRLTDIYCSWRARRNQGVFEPERLEALVLSLIFIPVGCLM